MLFYEKLARCESIYHECHKKFALGPCYCPISEISSYFIKNLLEVQDDSQLELFFNFIKTTKYQ